MNYFSVPDPKVIDVHCHIHASEFDLDRRAMLAAAQAAGVTAVLAMGEDLADNERLLALARATNAEDSAATARILPCFGLHPDQASKQPAEPVLQQIQRHAAELAAIGEIGLDYWIAREEPERQQQREALAQLIALGRELGLSLSVHSRSAGHYVIDFLLSQGAAAVCLHAFDGAAKHAVRAAEQGFFFSIPPSVARSPQKQKLVRRLPLEALLLESDSPALGPDPAARNVPANLLLAAKKVGELQHCSLDHVLAATAENTRRWAPRIFSLLAQQCDKTSKDPR